MVLLNAQQIQPLEPGAATPGQSAIISANNQTAHQSAIISAAKGGTKKRKGGAATGQVLPPLYGAAVSPAMQQQNYNNNANYSSARAAATNDSLVGKSGGKANRRKMRGTMRGTMRTIRKKRAKKSKKRGKRAGTDQDLLEQRRQRIRESRELRSDQANFGGLEGRMFPMEEEDMSNHVDRDPVIRRNLDDDFSWIENGETQTGRLRKVNRFGNINSRPLIFGGPDLPPSSGAIAVYGGKKRRFTKRKILRR
jgi:hypothetical protein